MKKQSTEKLLREKERHKERSSYSAEYGEYNWIWEGEPPENDDGSNVVWKPRWREDDEDKLKGKLRKEKSFSNKKIKQEER